jgi:hypothetical protein
MPVGDRVFDMYRARGIETRIEKKKKVRGTERRKVGRMAMFSGPDVAWTTQPGIG